MLEELSKSELLLEPADLDERAEENNSRFFLATIVPVEAPPPLPVAEEAAPLPVSPLPVPPPSVEEELCREGDRCIAGGEDLR